MHTMMNYSVPIIPPSPPEKPQELNPVIARCGQCGLEICRVMMYCCPDPNCPVFPKAKM